MERRMDPHAQVEDDQAPMISVARAVIERLGERLARAHAVVFLAENHLAEQTDSEAVPALMVALQEIRAVTNGLGEIADGRHGPADTWDGESG